MQHVEIDFDVFKELTNQRQAESETYNDVLRKLLKLPPAAKPQQQRAGGRPWIVSGTGFPAGSEFMADYKGRRYTGTVVDGKLRLSDGREFATPSAAAVEVTGNSVNGWRFWRCKLPGSSEFVVIERLRGTHH